MICFVTIKRDKLTLDRERNKIITFTDLPDYIYIPCTGWSQNVQGIEAKKSYNSFSFSCAFPNLISKVNYII